MPRFARLELWTDLPNAGGSRLSFIPDLLALQTTRSTDATDGVSLTLPRTSRVVPLLRAGQGVRVVRRDPSGVESADSWRLATLTDGSGPDATSFTYAATSPLADLARVDISQTLSTGETLHSFSQHGMTAAEIIDTFLIPCLAAHGLSYWSRGTIDNTAIVPAFSWSWWSALQLLQQIRTLVLGELTAHEVSTTGYAFDIVDQIGAAAPVARFRTRKNLLANQRVKQTDQQVTRCIPRGDQRPDGSGEYHSIARAMMLVTTVAGAVVTLADPAGQMSPITFANQYQNWYLYRQKTGGTWQITNSDPAAQTVALAATPGTLAAGEFVEFRVTEPATIRIGARPLSSSLVTATVVESLPYYSAAGGTGAKVVLSDAYDNSHPWPAFDGQYEDEYAIFHSQILVSNGVTSTGSLARFEFPVSVASVQVGDLMYYGPNNVSTKPYGGSRSYLWEVTSTDLANKYVFVKPHWTAHTQALPSIAASEAFVIRAATTLQILTTHASTHELEFAVTAPTFGSAGGQIVVIERRLGGGRLPNYLEDPVAVQGMPTGYGVIARPLDKPGYRGEGNAQPNPVFATWSNPTNPPDGYAVSGTSPLHSQNTDPTLVKYGAGVSWLVTGLDSVGAHTTVVDAPLAFLQSADYGLLTKCAIKVSLFLSKFRDDTKLSFSLSTGDGQSFPLKDYFSTDNTVGATGASLLAEGAWQDITFAGTDFITPGGVGPLGSLIDFRDRGGVRLHITAAIANVLSPNPSALVVYALDALAIMQVQYDPGAGVYPNGSYANVLVQQGAAQLVAYAQPLPVYTVKVLDIERLPNSPYGADALSIGGNLEVRDTELPGSTVTSTLRLMRLVTDELTIENSELTLASLPPQLTRLLALAGASSV